MNFPNALNPLRGTSQAWLLPFTWRLLQGAVKAAPVTVEVFLHHRFGARSGPKLFMGLLLLLVAKSGFGLSHPRPVPLFEGFLFAYVVAAICQWLSARFGAHGEHVHSYHTGQPWPLWQQLPLARSTIQRYVEPVLCYFMAWFIFTMDAALGHWLFLAATALLLQEWFRSAEMRTHHLDGLDSRVDNTERAPAVRTEPEHFVEARPAPRHRITPRPTPQRRRR